MSADAVLIVSLGVGVIVGMVAGHLISAWLEPRWMAKFKQDRAGESRNG